MKQDELEPANCGHGPAHAQCFHCRQVLCLPCWIGHTLALAAGEAEHGHMDPLAGLPESEQRERFASYGRGG